MTVEYASGPGPEVRRAGGQEEWLDVNCERAKAKKTWGKKYIWCSQG